MSSSDKYIQYVTDITQTDQVSYSLVTNYFLDRVAAELGFFYLFSLFLVGCLLNQVNGHMFSLKEYLMNRDFQLIKNEKLLRFVNFILMLLIWCFLFFPMVCLGVWSAALIKHSIIQKSVVTGGICVALIGLAFFFFMYATLQVKWSNFRFSKRNMIGLFLGYACLTAYQFAAVLSHTGDALFFGYTCIFLCANSIIVIAIIFLNSGMGETSMKDFLDTRLERGEPRDLKREEPFEDELAEERKDMEYVPTFGDITDLLTIADQYDPRTMSAFAGGIQKSFANLSKPKRKFISLAMWLFSCGILVAYSFIVYIFIDNSKLGFVTSIAVWITDVILYLMYNSRIVESPFLLSFTSVVNRFFLFIFGGQYWIYGYMVLYIYYGLILTVIIGKKRFPFEDAFQEVNLTNVHKKKNSVDISKVPEFLLAMITAILAILFIAMAATKPEGVALNKLTVGSTSFDFYMVGIFSIFFVATIFTLYCTYRLVLRKKKQLDPQVYYYIQNRKYDMYWIFMDLTYICAVIYSLIAYWASQNVCFLIVGIFGSLTLYCYLNAYLHYVMNDYKILEDISGLNEKIQRRNKKIDELKVKVVKFKQDLKQGKTAAIGDNQLALAQNIMKSNKEEKSELRAFKARQQAAFANGNTVVLKNSPTNKSPQNFVQMQRTMGITGTRFNPHSKAGNTVSAGHSRFNSITPTATQKIQLQTNEAEVNITVKSPYGKNNYKEEGDSDRIIREELNKIDKDADIYEGGDREFNGPIGDQSNSLNVSQNVKSALGELDIDQMDEQLAHLHDSDESSEDELDPNQGEVDQTSKCRKKQKLIDDWKTTMGPVKAYFLRKLRHNDYQIINSILISIISTALLALIVCLKSESLIGITIAVPFLHYGMAFFAFIRILSTDAKISPFEVTLFVLSYLVQYGWGIAYTLIAYTPHQLDYNQPGAAEAGPFIVIYLFLIPLITSFIAAALKWMDDAGKFSKLFTSQVIITLLQAVGLMVCAYIFLTFVPGVITSVATVIFGYCVLQAWLYIRNDYYLPRAWQIINIIIISLAVVSAFIVSLCVRSFLTFEGFSISVWTLCFFILLYSFLSIYQDIQKSDVRPIYYSPWIFPVYVYDPKKNEVVSRNAPAICLIVAHLILILWAILCSVWIQPGFIGVSLSIIFEISLIISVLYLVSVSQLQFASIQRYIDNMLIRLAWLDTKKGYISQRGAPNRYQLLTYESMRKRRNHFRNHIRILEGREHLSWEDKFEGIELETKEQANLDWVDSAAVDLTSIISCYQYLFNVEKQLSWTYIQELELIIQFQLLLVQQAENLQLQERKYLFRFLNEKKAALFALKIVINIPEKGKMSIRYARVITQIQKLTPEKQTMFNSLRQHFIEEQRKIEEQQKELARIEEEKQKERQEQMAQMSEDKKKLLQNLDENMDVALMPDCEIKYKKILKESKDGVIFEDKTFGHDDKALGPNACNRGVAKWVRASDVPGCRLFKDKISFDDVEQGALGDCYLLSAISVLGDKYVKEIIVTLENAEEWRECGAFCLKFYKNGYTEYIIIDDYFPAYANGSWAFVKGGGGLELWPMVLEKGYAKMYGSYSFIEAGKVQYALQDMTNGFPEQIDLKVDGKNINVLWEKLKTMKRYGALMGAGSPENIHGDKAISEQGIVQGHAYAVLDIVEVDGFRLMQLRNPHGAVGVEWSGDWCDDSSKWTERFKNKVGYKKEADGVFWMGVLDFVEQFSYLYICRVLSVQDGWTKCRIKDEWKGKSAEGLPTKTNPNAKLELNPQYDITITKPCDGFIMMKQKDAVNMFKGKHLIFFMVAKQNGERITKVEKETLVCRSGAPTNLNIITAECDFDKTVKYPYKFTLMVANAEHGQSGEGQYDFSVYATDPNITVTRKPDL